MAHLQLTRFNDGPDLPSKVAGMFGTLSLPSGKSIFTVERAWVGNKPYVSCIPDGVYTLRKRRSNVVEDTTGGKYLEGWELTDVTGRTYIMIHPGNWPHNFEGCIGPGLTYGLVMDAQGTYRLGVGRSMDAFEILMDELDGEEEHTLEIIPKLREYP